MKTSYLTAVIKVVDKADKTTVVNVTVAIPNEQPSLRQMNEAEYQAKATAFVYAEREGISVASVDCLCLADAVVTLGAVINLKLKGGR